VNLKSKNQNLTTFKTRLYLIESSVTAEAKISHLMRRLKILETKEQGVVNQVNPPQMTNPCCTYCHTLNYVFKECPVYLAQQMLPESMNADFARLYNNSYFKTYNPGWRNHPIFYGVRTVMNRTDQIFTINFMFIIISSIFNPISN